MNDLLKVKITLETEIVINNYYRTPEHKAAIDIFIQNKDYIIENAISSGEYKVETCEVTSLKDLPEKWNGDCYPFDERPSWVFENKTLKQILNETENKI